MSDQNSINFTGRLTADATLRSFPSSGAKYATFSVANNTGYDEFAKTQFFKCMLIGKRAEGLQPYLLKGTKVAITGSMESNDWTGEDGKEHKDWQVKIVELNLISSPKNNQSQGELSYEVVEDEPPTKPSKPSGKKGAKEETLDERLKREALEIANGTRKVGPKDTY